MVLEVRNAGPDNHELIVVRRMGASLPLRPDGLTMDEDRVEPYVRGALEPGSPNLTRSLRLHLSRGRYVLVCNMSGHLLGGMHTELVVR